MSYTHTSQQRINKCMKRESRTRGMRPNNKMLNSRERRTLVLVLSSNRMGCLVFVQSNRGDSNSNPGNLASAFARCSTGGTVLTSQLRCARASPLLPTHLPSLVHTNVTSPLSHLVHTQAMALPLQGRLRSLTSQSIVNRRKVAGLQAQINELNAQLMRAKTKSQTRDQYTASV